MIRIAIVEDHKDFADTLLSYLGRYTEETHEAVTARVFGDGAAFLDGYTGDFQIVFMDIAMPGMNGLEAARKLREKDPVVCLIFITSLARYAIKGYEVGAVDFLVKPVAYELFKIKLKKAVDHIRVDSVYYVKIPNGIQKVNLSDLIYVESSKHYLNFHAVNQDYRMRGTIRQIQDDFLGKGFAMVNSYLIVNLSYVDKVQGNTLEIDGQQLLIARSFKAEFLKQMAVFLGSRGI